MTSPSTGIATTIDDVGDDFLQNIIGRLPAVSFASAACVSRSWNRVCNRVLCRPKLSSACFTAYSIEVAVEEVVNKVLSEPIRPHFAIASVGYLFDLQLAHQLISAKLGSKIPVITNHHNGCMGRDASSNEYEQVYATDDGHFHVGDETETVMLVIGFLPGIKVKTVPLLKQIQVPDAVMIDKFVRDIMEFSDAISGCKSPAAIIMFYLNHDMQAVMEKLDYALSLETVIVGEHVDSTRHTSGITASVEFASDVALVFVVDKKKPPGIGETHFHAVMSSGLLSVGPAYEVASVKKDGHCTFLTARREGSDESLSGYAILNQADEAASKEFSCSDNEEGLYIAGGAKTGDTFRVYFPDTTAAVSSVASVSNHLRSFKQGSTTGGDKREVFGGLIFASYCRGESYFDQPNFVSSPFLDNFPGVTLGGTFNDNQIWRGNLTAYVNESQQKLGRYVGLHEWGDAYLIMSYTP
ncbi:F-box/LRR-repeat protein At5g63520-like [Bidens hawaiensis]|uniref:F-box/LRR-repeat protein At5g63520-like n=1 Tax=Bidens hawaiensis TaxID=980011 RepID=UPI00404AECAC